ncbi:NAD(P)/FAD-dependent oxidoreductase [Exiguobacterium aestuarii]|uniref:NAD(P)/FAD-dependent oxidoreductase n=1 Tax=Exiguobacterium aestuarii TaxID=273527 RepID=UPI001CD336E1|nr:FAD-dependent oxidoreductase [Exiguobacterium aestuarii]MCA0980520.1 FAD-dependent oxidoreductase [Exiguobacterium aestuarii]
MKPVLMLAGLGHGQLEILDRLDEIREHYEVQFIGGRQTVYTGAFPQVIAGLMNSATVQLPRLEPVAERVISIDPHQQTVQTEQGLFHYDQLVLATGAKSRGIGTPLKPMSQALLDRIDSSPVVTIVGGGKAGVELAFTCAKTKDVTLYAKKIMPYVPLHRQKQIERLLVKSGIMVVKQQFQDDASEGLLLDATGVVPVEWWAESGLAKPDNFIATDEYLRHHQFTNIYITGDMASILNGGVDAVRSGRFVAKRLLGETSQPFRRRQSMNILLTTPGRALLTFGQFTWHGRLPYYVKRFIDSRYVRHYK